jgi:UDP-N-acetylmuramoylalanine--D-glutamate ligase
MRVLILGAAVSGRAAARLARRLGHEVTIYDRNHDALIGIDDAAVAIRSGEWNNDLLADVDLVISSPGFPEHTGPIPDVVTSGLPLVSEMEFAARLLHRPYAAVTGTNGKTTVTSAAAAMLQASGIDAVAAGNIGTALSDVVLEAPRAVVVEASSFQLRFTREFHPAAAALLNIAPDHLDWHRDLAEYAAAKQRIFANQTEADVLVYDADDPGARGAVRDAAARLIPVGGSARPADGTGPEGAEVVIGEMRVARPDLDRAFMVDLVAAATLAAHLGANATGVGTVMQGFAPGSNRRERVGEWDGVVWVNDSKATNPHAAVAAATAYPAVVLIAGGRNKGLDLSPLAAVPGVRWVIAIGEATADLEKVFRDGRLLVAADLAAAVTRADAVARPGDTVLLAPGCASFDMFESYAARGAEFVRLVRQLKGEGDGN